MRHEGRGAGGQHQRGRSQPESIKQILYGAIILLLTAVYTRLTE
jgi:hypothetical protein